MNSARRSELRDMFACAMVARVDADASYSSKDVCEVLGLSPSDYDYLVHLPIFAARMAYRYADAMLAERGEA